MKSWMLKIGCDPQGGMMLGALIFAPIADRAYGLRDFTILDPDGVGIRFGTRPAAGHA